MSVGSVNDVGKVNVPTNNLKKYKREKLTGDILFGVGGGAAVLSTLAPKFKLPAVIMSALVALSGYVYSKHNQEKINQLEANA